MRVGIIGGGISGLTVAYYLQKMGVPYDLFEANEQVGGAMKSVQVKNYLMEMGPNQLKHSPELEELICEMKLQQEVMEGNPANSDNYILKQGKYHKIHGSPLALLRSNFFSFKTRYRFLQERYVSKSVRPNETAEQFFKRRFGRNILHFTTNILSAGLLTSDPTKLLVSRAFPFLAEYEQKYGSVLKGFVKEKRAKQARFFTFRNGMQTLPNSIASKLISIHTGERVEMITRNKGRYIISTTPAAHNISEYDLLVLALPAHKAADILEFTFPGMSAALQNITYPPLAVVHSVYPKKEVGLELEGAGVYHPVKENQFTSGNIWSSALYQGRCKKDEVLITSYIGGSLHPEYNRLDREVILENVHKELSRNFNITAQKPTFQYLHLWQHALPQLDLFIEDVHDMAGILENERVFIAANWFSGLSVSSCIREAKLLAQKIQKLALRSAA
ncbi:MAG: protoporphyrinogen oxidase [Hymenobacteraceae bacterium]|nr:protoporphyrinogen oxidase [Hymenobacteraceae bacterium]MDX5395964.1 protoporphyrinogen oxidase [Hymenobacteraceae bacterium]MDX5443858.1 protoporphyrinogen oxidase [Hymenobacteraceae bacterium]MDX5512025.1 protoporphyrinogen oxidase [Hymenobacteraceae bacterium]